MQKPVYNEHHRDWRYCPL